MVDYFEVGQISNTHGLKGEVKVRAFTKSLKDFQKYESILIDFNKELKEYDIECVRFQKDIVLLKLKGIDDIDSAEKLKGYYIKIPREASAQKVQKDEFFIADLIGSEVYQNSEFVGTLEDIFTSGGCDVYVIKRKGKNDLLLPALKDVIKSINVEEGKIEVEIPRGLEDEV